MILRQGTGRERKVVFSELVTSLPLDILVLKLEFLWLREEDLILY